MTSSPKAPEGAGIDHERVAAFCADFERWCETRLPGVVGNVSDAEIARAYLALRSEVAALRGERERLRAIVDAQANDYGLWCAAKTVVEAYQQQELRKLHAAIEGDAALQRAEEASP